MNGSDIVGYTFAEIALVLLFAVVAIILPANVSLSGSLKKAEQQAAEWKAKAEHLAKELAEKQQGPSEAKAGSSILGLRSKQFPSCIEKGVSRTWLFSATALTSDRYLVDGEELTLSQIRNRYASALEGAAAEQCKESIQVFYSPTISLSQYDRALRDLEAAFYVKRLGPDPNLGKN